MSQIARCGLCDQRVRIPDVDSDAWVRCPHCQEEFQLSSIANDLPPRLEVVGDHSVVIDSGSSNDGAVGGEPLTDFPGVQNPTMDGESMPAPVPAITAVDVDPAAEVASGSQKASVRSPQTLHANRTKKASPGVAATAAKVVLGGVVGLALGQLILWWLPAPYQSDPLDLAVSMPAQLEFLLPPTLRASYEPAPETEPTKTSPDEPTLSEVLEASSTTTEFRQRPAQPIIGEEPVPPTDLKYSLQTAVAEDNAFGDRKYLGTKHVETWYGGLRQLAFCVTNIATIDGVNREVVDEMRRFLANIASDPQKTSTITNQAWLQLSADPAENQEGIVIVGNVEQIRPAGELFRTTLRLRDVNEQVDVISRQDPRASEVFAEGDFVLLLGVVIVQPAELQGYKGPDQAVVFGGFPVKATPESG